MFELDYVTIQQRIQGVYIVQIPKTFDTFWNSHRNLLIAFKLKRCEHFAIASVKFVLKLYPM